MTIKKSYKVIAKGNMVAPPHSWTKGLDYRVIEGVDHFVLTSDQGSVGYLNTVRDQILIEDKFQIIEPLVMEIE